MGRYQIICSLDGQEPKLALYGEYADMGKRTFDDEQSALPIRVYLVKRSVRLLWNSVFPDYQIVPIDE